MQNTQTHLQHITMWCTFTWTLLQSLLAHFMHILLEYLELARTLEEVHTYVVPQQKNTMLQKPSSAVRLLLLDQ